MGKICAEIGLVGHPFDQSHAKGHREFFFASGNTLVVFLNSLSAKSVLAGEKLVAAYSIST
jgi:hypothetical protein